MGAALYLLVRDVPGRAACISRLAIGPFVLFYGAGEAILGVATGVLVQHADDVPADQRPAAADAVEALWENVISDDFLISIGGVAWIVAAIAAAIALRGAGAPLAASILLGLSAIAVVHAPPVGPVALVLFAAAVVLLARSRRALPAVDEPAPTPATGPAPERGARASCAPVRLPIGPLEPDRRPSDFRARAASPLSPVSRTGSSSASASARYVAS